LSQAVLPQSTRFLLKGQWLHPPKQRPRRNRGSRFIAFTNMSNGNGDLEGVMGPGPTRFFTLRSRLCIGAVIGMFPFVVSTASIAIDIIATLGWIWFAYSMYEVFLTIRCTGVDLLNNVPSIIGYDLDEKELYAVDGAPPEIQDKRRAGVAKLEASFKAQAPQQDAVLRGGLSDMRTNAGTSFRMPFMFAKHLKDKLALTPVFVESDGPMLYDANGRAHLDLHSGYGANVAGHDIGKQFVKDGNAKVGKLSPYVLGPFHPVTADVVARLKKISGLDAVSFHMSGTEACMAATLQCRFATRRRLVVVISAAYHGWWDGVLQVFSTRRAQDLLILPIMNSSTLSLIRARSAEIACVMVSALTDTRLLPNQLVILPMCGGDVPEVTNARIEEYGAWYRNVRALCTECQVPFIIDDVLNGFRIAKGGLQELFNVQADMVVYGKALGGGMPCGAVVGRHWLMQKTDPLDKFRACFVVGTFSASPPVVGAMCSFLEWLDTDEATQAYVDMQENMNNFVATVNKQFTDLGLPICVRNFRSCWTILYTQASRYNWMYSYYLLEQGVEIPLIGNGRLQTTLEWKKEHYDSLVQKMVAAAISMRDDGWWWSDGKPANPNAILWEILKHLPSQMKALRRSRQNAKANGNGLQAALLKDGSVDRTAQAPHD